MKYLVVITARGGSKGIPGKNIKHLAGKPLILYTVEAARKVFQDQQIYVSTDSQEIKEVVESSGLGVPFLRPAELATDTSSSEDVLKHAITEAIQNGLLFDAVVLLQPTSPFRNEEHIQGAIKQFEKHPDSLLLSVNQAKENPYYTLMEEDNEGFLQKSKEATFTRRQDCPTVWNVNGAIYIFPVDKFKTLGLKNMKKIKYTMNKVSSIDIDDVDDWFLAESLLKNGYNPTKPATRNHQPPTSN